MIAARNLQATFWAIDGAGRVMAVVLLALKYLGSGMIWLLPGFCRSPSYEVVPSIVMTEAI